jgi:hypothetical protein
MLSKHIVLAVALSVSVVSIAWSADEPASPPAASPPAAASPTPAADATAAPPAAAQPAAAAKAPAKEATTAADSKDSDAEKHLLARGYKKETRSNGQVVFCRKEIELGSRFETKKCGTAESMAFAEQQARDLMHNSQYSGGTKTN